MKHMFSPLLFVLALLLMPGESYAQRSTVLTENLQRHVRTQERLGLAQLFRLVPGGNLDAEILSFSITARNFSPAPSEFQIQEQGRTILSGLITMSRTSLKVPLPNGVRIQNLVLVLKGDLFIETLQAEIKREFNFPQRIFVNRLLPAYAVMPLGFLLPHEQRPIHAITIEASTHSVATGILNLTTRWGEVIGSIRVTRSPFLPRLVLLRPLPLRELELRSAGPVNMDIRTLEIEFDRAFPRY